ncbi:MAG: hypothetical protein ACO4AI_00715 [Prochlorothrix sp.]
MMLIALELLSNTLQWHFSHCYPDGHLDELGCAVLLSKPALILT